MAEPTRLDVIVIGAGQAGLAAGYRLRRTNLNSSSGDYLARAVVSATRIQNSHCTTMRPSWAVEHMCAGVMSVLGRERLRAHGRGMWG